MSVKNQLKARRANPGGAAKKDAEPTSRQYVVIRYLPKFEISFKHISSLRGSWPDGAGSNLALASQIWSRRPIGSRRAAGVAQSGARETSV